MIGRRACVGTAILIAGVLCVIAGSFCSLPDPKMARELAVGAFQRHAKQENWDARLFEGPRSREVGGFAYAFEWIYYDSNSKLTVIVPVDRGGWTKVFFFVGDSYDGSQGAIDTLDGLLERVKRRSRKRGGS